MYISLPTSPSVGICLCLAFLLAEIIILAIQLRLKVQLSFNSLLLPLEQPNKLIKSLGKQVTISHDNFYQCLNQHACFELVTPVRIKA